MRKALTTAAEMVRALPSAISMARARAAWTYADLHLRNYCQARSSDPGKVGHDSIPQ